MVLSSDAQVTARSFDWTKAKVRLLSEPAVVQVEPIQVEDVQVEVIEILCIYLED